MSTMSQVRARVYEILFVMPQGDKTTLWVNRSIAVLILLNVLCVILESVDSIQAAASTYFEIFEIVSVSIFVVEYIARLWACVEAPRFSHMLTGRLRFVVSPFPLVDLLAIVPALIPIGMALDLRFIRLFRLIRLLRILKLARYSRALQLLGRVMNDSRDLLIVNVLVLAFLLVITGGLMYFAEKDAQPELFSSIPASIWYSVITLTTVGYGDVYPITATGKLVAGLMAVLGIGLVAIPTGIISSSFLRELEDNRASTLRPKGTCQCPNCGTRFVPDQSQNATSDQDPNSI